MRDCRVETVDHVSDSDSEERDSNQPPTIALHPSHQGPPTYLLMSSKQEKVTPIIICQLLIIVVRY